MAGGIEKACGHLRPEGGFSSMNRLCPVRDPSRSCPRAHRPVPRVALCTSSHSAGSSSKESAPPRPAISIRPCARKRARSAQVLHAQWRVGVYLLPDPVLHADVDRVECVEDVELHEGDGLHAVHDDRAPHDDRVEPAAPPAACPSSPHTLRPSPHRLAFWPVSSVGKAPSPTRVV